MDFIELIVKMNLSVTKEVHEKYTPKKYDTPTQIGIKWQMDVKYVPKICYVGTDGQKFYQYTVIDEASRERILQTDNGQEFTHISNTKRIHPLDALCNELNIQHKLIKPRTPRHNGKVERSHRNDQQRFYSYLSFYSYDDLLKQMKAYLNRSNNIPMQILNWLTPIQKREQLKKQC